MNGNIYAHPMRLFKVLHLHQFKQHFTVGLTLQKDTSFEEWQKVSYNPQTYNINYYKEYVGAVDIYQLNEQDERTYGVRLEEAFPKTVAEIAYGHEVLT